MKILVITPVKFPAPYLQEAISSVQQNNGNFKVKHLIIYQGRAIEDLQNIQHERYELEYIHNDGSGVSQNRNLGLLESKNFDLIAFLDADDVWAPNIIVAAIDQIKYADVVSFYGLPIGEKNRFVRVTTPFIGEKLLNKTEMALNYIGCPSGVFFKREALSQKFNEALAYYEDYVFYLQNFLNKSVKKSATSHFYYRHHKLQTTAKALIGRTDLRIESIKRIHELNFECSKKIDKIKNMFLLKEIANNKIQKIRALCYISIIYPTFVWHQIQRFLR